MANPFAFAFSVMACAYVAEARKERGYGTDTWSTSTRFLISHALVRNSDCAAPLIEQLEQGKRVEDQALTKLPYPQ